MGLITQRFESVSHWLDVLEHTEQPEPRTSQTSRELTRSSWFGTPSFPAAIELCKQGWSAGLERMHALSARLSEELITMLYIPEVVYDVTGDMLDIGRFVRGEPEDFMTLVPAEIEQEPRILRIVVNTFVSSGTSGEAVFGKGAAICALADALEQHGKRVEIDAVCATTEGARTWVRLKDTNAPLQLANLIFLLAHLSTFRRLFFGTWELLPIVNRHQLHADGGYYGTPGELGSNEDRGDIYVPCSSYDVMRNWQAAEAEHWILAELSKQGIYASKEVE